MRILFHAVPIVAVAWFASCTGANSRPGWVVEKTEIALYHSSTIDEETGSMFHVEYCAAKLTRGSEVLHVIYRPIDFPERNPGFAEGDTVIVSGLESAKDFGAVDGPDYWIQDIKIAAVSDKPGSRESSLIGNLIFRAPLGPAGGSAGGRVGGVGCSWVISVAP